jgi:hypothetical protein
MPPSNQWAEENMICGDRESAIAICKEIHTQPWKTGNSNQPIAPEHHFKTIGSEFFTDD